MVKTTGRIDLKTMAVIIAVLGGIASPFISIGASKAEHMQNTKDINDTQDSISRLWQAIRLEQITVGKHDAILPTMAERLSNLETGQGKTNDKIDKMNEKMNEKMDRVLMEIRKIQ